MQLTLAYKWNGRISNTYSVGTVLADVI